jgi:hypothetical protein
MSSPPEFDAEAYVEAALAALGLAVEPAWKPGVVANFQRTAEIAKAFLDFPLADEDEPAPVFTP